MQSLSSIRRASSLLQSSSGLKWVAEVFSNRASFRGITGLHPPQNARNLGLLSLGENVSAPYALSFQSSVHSSSQKHDEMEASFKPMSFVREIIEEDGKGMLGGFQLSHYGSDQKPDIVHINLMRNNTFVTVTDSDGNKKGGASSGCLPELRGGPKLSRYAAEATAEHAGRIARNLGLKSIVVKVKGFTYFAKKRQAIMSFREGFSKSRRDNSIIFIEDTTRVAHNGCRLPKKRRI